MVTDKPRVFRDTYLTTEVNEWTLLVRKRKASLDQASFANFFFCHL